MPKWLDNAREHVKRGGWRSQTTDALNALRADVAELLRRVPASSPDSQQLTRVERKLDALTADEARRIGDVMANLQDMVARVAAVKGVEDSVATMAASIVTEVADLKTQLDAAIANNDPAALQAVSDGLDGLGTGLDGIKAKLAEAVVATPPTA